MPLGLSTQPRWQPGCLAERCLGFLSLDHRPDTFFLQEFNAAFKTLPRLSNDPLEEPVQVKWDLPNGKNTSTSPIRNLP